MRALVLLLAAALAPAATLDQLLPPRPTIVFGLRASTLFALLDQQEGGKKIHSQITGLLAFTPLAGFDPFRDVDEFVLAADGSGKNPPAIVVITGRFDPARIAGAKGHPYKHAILVGDSKPSQTLAILDAGTLLMGDLTLVKAAIDRAATNLAPNPVAARIEDLRTRYDIWAFSDRLDAALPAALPAAAAAAVDPFRGMDRFSFGAAFSHDFALAGEVHFRKAADLDRILAMIRGIEPQISPAKFDLTTADNTIKVAISIPEAEWKKVLAERGKSGGSPGLPAFPGISISGAESSKPSQPVRPTPQVITRDSSGSTVSLTLPGKQ